MAYEGHESDGGDPVNHPVRNEGYWFSLAGPTALGRSVMLAPGVDAPPPWVHSQRIQLNELSLRNPTTLRAVRRAFLLRTPVIYEVDPTMNVPERGTDEREVWDVPPETDFVVEATWRLARSNAVDARDVLRPVWPPGALALGAGAIPANGLKADVVLPDGTLTWCDGGPLH